MGLLSPLLEMKEKHRKASTQPAPLLLLGILFRFLAGCCLLLYVSAQTSGWARFFGQLLGLSQSKSETKVRAWRLEVGWSLLCHPCRSFAW